MMNDELGGCAAGLPTWGKHKKHQRCVALFVTLGLRPRKANTSAKRVRCQDGFHESHSLARCSKWAHLHFSSACASVQTGIGIISTFTLAVLSPKATLGVALPPRGAGAAVAGPLPFCPCEAQRRHRGARSAMASAMSVRCKIASRYAP